MSVPVSRGAGRGAVIVFLLASLLPLAAAAQATKAASLNRGSYLGGKGTDRITAVAYMRGGDIVVVGNTNSENFDPNATGATVSSQDYFVARFDDGGGLAFVKVFGGSNVDSATAVAVDSDTGDVYIVGSTRSSDITNAGATHGGPYKAGEDGFVAKVSYEGVPQWFTYLTGDANDVATGVAFASNSLYVAGYTNSTNFLGNQAAPTGDGFVLRLNASTPDARPWGGAKLIGGTGLDQLFGVMESAGRLLVVGTTASSTLSTNPPATGSLHGLNDALVAKLDETTGATEWITYVGGNKTDEGAAVAITASNQIAVAGATTSTDLGPATTPGGRNAFVTWLSAEGAPQRTRVIGGGLDDEAVGLATDGYNTTYVVGTTASSGDFPLTTSTAFDPSIESGSVLREGFLAALPGAGGDGWVTFFGGNGKDIVTGVSIYESSRFAVSMETSSMDGFPPSQNGGYDLSLSSPPDGYLAVVDTPSPVPPLPGDVNDGTDASNELDEQTSTTTLSANWTPFIPTAAITRYEWAIGTVNDPEELQPFTSVGTATSATRSGLDLKVGTQYIVTVRGQNSVGITAVKSSDGVTIIGTGEADGGTGGNDGGTGEVDGGTGNTDGGTGQTDGGTGDAGADGGDVTPPKDEDPHSPIGWGCDSAGGAGVPLLLGLMALVLLARRLRDAGRQPRL